MTDIVERLNFWKDRSDYRVIEIGGQHSVVDDTKDAVTEIERLRATLRIIAGIEQPADNLISNVRIARLALKEPS